MAVHIHHIATEVPEHGYPQTLACQRMMGWARNPRTRRIIDMIYDKDRSGIEKRYSVCGDFEHEAGGDLFRTLPDGSLQSPGTAERNALYARASKEISVSLAQRTLDECGHFAKEDITHVVFASCTGFANPGPDYHIVRELGLRDSVERYVIGFMGCYAAFPALRMASTICQANPKAVVLVMCLEFCSLHVQVSDEPDSIVANSLFADGAACALVSAKEPNPNSPSYRVEGFRSALIPSSEAHMAWEIGNQGFNMVLSSYVPDLIGSNVQSMMNNVLDGRGMAVEDIANWAVHPGGRAILDKVQSSLSLSPQALDVSRQILHDYGNMSSATVLFVLKEMLSRDACDPGATLAMAFGPGLTVETALLQKVGVPSLEEKSVRDRAQLLLEAASL